MPLITATNRCHYKPKWYSKHSEIFIQNKNSVCLILFFGEFPLNLIDFYILYVMFLFV